MLSRFPPPEPQISPGEWDSSACQGYYDNANYVCQRAQPGLEVAVWYHSFSSFAACALVQATPPYYSLIRYPHVPGAAPTSRKCSLLPNTQQACAKTHL